MEIFKKKNENHFLEYMNDIDLFNLGQYHKPIILEFSGPHCSPCMQYQKVLEKVKDVLKDDVIIKTINVNKYMDIAKEFGVMSIPRIFFYDSSGKIISSYTKILSYEDTMEIMEQCLFSK